MKRTIIAFIALSCLLTAQPRPGSHPMTPLQDHRRGNRLEMMKMWQLTERLALTEEQASKFFPRYNALEKELRELGTEQRELLGEMRKMMGEDKEVTDKDLKRITKKVSQKGMGPHKLYCSFFCKPKQNHPCELNKHPFFLV